MKTRHAMVMATLLALLFGAPAGAQEQGIAWGTLTDAQQEVLTPFRQDWDQLPAQRQQRLARGAARWGDMTPAERNAAKERFRSWRELSTDRRELIRERYEIFQDLPQDEQRRILQNFERFRDLRQDRRDELRKRYREMTPAERRALRDRLHDRRTHRPRPRD